MEVTLNEEEAHNALISASKAGSTWLVKRLIESGVDPNYMYGVCLKLAETYGHEDTAAVLRNAGARLVLEERPVTPESGPAPH